MRRNLFVPELIGDISVANQDSQVSTPDFGSFIEDYLDSQQLAVRYITEEGRLETLVFPTKGMREAAHSPPSVCELSMFSR